MPLPVYALPVLHALPAVLLLLETPGHPPQMRRAAVLLTLLLLAGVLLVVLVALLAALRRGHRARAAIRERRAASAPVDAWAEAGRRTIPVLTDDDAPLEPDGPDDADPGDTQVRG